MSDAGCQLVSRPLLQSAPEAGRRLPIPSIQMSDVRGQMSDGIGIWRATAAQARVFFFCPLTGCPLTSETRACSSVG